jgi:hypothetical protein
MDENKVVTGTSGTLTDGTGISRLTSSKVLKDAVLDFLLTAPTVFVGLSVTDLGGALQVPVAVGLGLADALIRVIYRVALRWAQSPTP